jgi:NAD(P)-dependent dehydrogenase (short-subunit alcohol dehydrogenase family)
MIGVDDGPKGTALVTGANRGLGLAIALELAGAGFPTIAAMRDTGTAAQLLTQGEERGVGHLVSLQRLDLTDPSTFTVPDELSILVNNAGTEGPRTPVEHLTREALVEVFETNVFGPAELTRLALPIMRRNGGGVICDVTSLARVVPQPFLAAYRASKCAIAAMLESLRGEAAGFGIRVIELLPGPIATDMLQRNIASAMEPQPAPYDELGRRFAERRMSKDRAADARCGLSVNHRATAPAEAARRAVAAILAVNGPLRYGIEPLSERVLAAWRSLDDETFMRDALNVFGADVDPVAGQATS